jgi:hypothetical protein
VEASDLNNHNPNIRYREIFQRQTDVIFNPMCTLDTAVQERHTYVTSGCRREVDENYALMGYYALSSGNLLPKFRDILSVPSSRVKNPKGDSYPSAALSNRYNITTLKADRMITNREL